MHHIAISENNSNDATTPPKYSNPSKSKPPSPSHNPHSEWTSYTGRASILEERAGNTTYPPGFEPYFIFGAQPQNPPSIKTKFPHTHSQQAQSTTSHSTEHIDTNKPNWIHLSRIPYSPTHFLWPLTTNHIYIEVGQEREIMNTRMNSNFAWKWCQSTNQTITP